MSLIEYLYVDDDRLDSYAEQIAHPVTYDKVPVWKAELGLTGPKAAASQERRARTLTRHEKITKLVQHLREKDLVHTEESLKKDPIASFQNETRKSFVYETCSASRIVISPKPGTDFPGIVLWLSPSAQTSEHGGKLEDGTIPGIGSLRGMVCLLEDFRKNDESPNPYGWLVSSYTVLTAMFFAIVERIDTLEFTQRLPNDELKSNDQRMVAWTCAGSIGIDAFVQDPIGTLERFGCLAAKPRKIRTLYRIREYGTEYPRHQRIGLFGYPIFIAAED